MHRKLFVAGAAAIAIVLGACASTGGSGATGSDAATITAADIAQTSAATAFDAVQRLRPQWLVVSDPRSISGGGPGTPDIGTSGIVVYLDGVRAGGPDMLKNINAQSVVRMHFLTPSEATNIYGTGSLFGAIQVTTRHGGS